MHWLKGCPGVVTTGSGSLAAMAVFEDKYKPNMEVSLGFLNLSVSSLSNPHHHENLGGLKL